MQTVGQTRPKGKVIMPEWIMKVAQALLENWSIGTYSHFCDEVDFDTATDEEIADMIWREYQAAQHSVQETDGRLPSCTCNSYQLENFGCKCGAKASPST